MHDWVLTLAMFTPLAGALLIMLIPKENELLVKQTALATTILTAVWGGWILKNFDYDHTAKLQFGQNKQWISLINSRYILGIDGISLPLLALTVFIVPLVIIYSWDHFPEPHNPKAFLALVLLLETGMIGTFVAQDLILFFIFFELVLLPCSS